MEGAWASRSAASARNVPAYGGEAAAPRPPRWPSTPGSGPGGATPAPATAPARAGGRPARPRRPSAGLRPGGPGRHRPGQRGGRLGRDPGRLDAAAGGPHLRRPGRGGAGRAAGAGAAGADGAAAGPGGGDADRPAQFVAPGAAAELPGLLYRMGWDDADLDLRALGRARTSPPRPPTSAASARLRPRPPVLDTAAAPPQARLLLGTLAAPLTGREQEAGMHRRTGGRLLVGACRPSAVRSEARQSPIRASTKAPGSNGARSSAPSPSPISFTGNAEPALDRADDDAALGGAVELGEDDAGDVHDLGEDPGLDEAVLPGGGVQDEQDLVQRTVLLHDPLDLAQLVHEPGFWPAGRRWS
ncbi:hypothetical protein SCYAM73S_02539 [Streptomyces cyaneofuscatus]